MKNLRSFVVSVSLTASLVVPATVFAARPLSAIVDTSAATVSRANFLSWAFEALELPRESTSCQLPYVRYPKGLKATLCAAQTQGALDVFGRGKQYVLNQSITRGEAIQVITALTDKQENVDVSAFKDIKDDLDRNAVMNAIVLKWMVPARANSFGLTTKLTGAEALSLLESSAKDVTRSTKTITIQFGGSPSLDTELPKSDLMNAIWQLLTKDYLYQDKLSEEEAAYKALEGMVDSLNDPYTTFFRPAGAEDFQQQIKGELSGIGAQIDEKDGDIIIVAPLPGSPAERAGLVIGDIILEANGVSLHGLGTDKAVTHIRGERGTTVKLKLRRGGSEIIVTVTRDSISIPEIQVKWQGDIAVVQLIQFGETTEKRIRSIFSDIAVKNPKGVVLDLRNNGGGLLTAADILLSSFVPRGTVVAKVKSRTETTEEKTQDEPVLTPGTKVVVLVNKGSASASEIVAGALQDLKRATIVGAQTFGKGTVQEVIGFRSGEAIKLTIAEWFTPLGRTINGTGIKPDVVLDSTDRDEQLKRALDILR